MPSYEQVRVIEDPGTGEGYFGRRSVSVSEDGEIIVVGAAGRQSAYIFEGSTTHTLAPSGAPAFYGQSVSVSPDGETVVVGAWDGGEEPGKAYVYSAPSWSLVATLTNPDDEGDDIFGYSVAAANGGTVAVLTFTSGGEDTVHMFRGDSYGSHVALSAGGAKFFRSLSVSDDGKVVAAQGEANTVIFHGSNWSDTATLTTPDGHVGFFSESANVSGDGSAVLTAGQANFSYIFSGSGWDTVTYIPQPIAFEEGYGDSCATDYYGDVSIITAPSADAELGKVYAFEGPYDYDSITPDDPTLYENFGLSVDLSSDGSTLVVGSGSDRVVVFTATKGEGWGLLL